MSTTVPTPAPPGTAPPAGLSVGLVHDYLLVMRGAERTFEAIGEAWPDAPIYTTVYSSEDTLGRFEDRDVRTSPLQRFGVRQDGFRRLAPAYPWAVGKLDVSEHDVVVSSSSAFAHGVRKRPGALHLCYCYTPLRYAWHERDLTRSKVPAVARPLMDTGLDAMRRWDRRQAAEVDTYVAISALSRDRIFEAYGREAEIIHPPVETERFDVDDAPETEDFVLTVGEVTAHKRLDVALEGARRAGVPAKVVGTGPDMERLRAEYGETTEFLGRVDDATLPDLYSRAKAVLVPNVEEFGITAVEAQASGTPVIATAAGGATETVVDGETGILLPTGSTAEFAEALHDADLGAFDAHRLADQAERFSRPRFIREMREAVDRAVRAD
ncbi:glycosyltransferase [Patulibacter sp. NPDC049589]|uniref:glycosyltransferase n=1 Tax=Patulibacter sp. NPDC049589 TaxID=3154731 RepID=UPI003449478F